MNLPAARDARRPLRYIVAGCFNTAVSYGVYALGMASDLGLFLASAIGLLAGVSVGFVSQGRYTFRSTAPGALSRYLLAWALMYALHVGIVSGLQHQGLDPYSGGLVAVAVITALSYFVLRDLVFQADRVQTNSR